MILIIIILTIIVLIIVLLMTIMIHIIIDMILTICAVGVEIDITARFRGVTLRVVVEL